MPTPEQAFNAYYASMTDAELLMVAANRKSLIPVARKVIAEELLRRHLTAPADSPVEAIHSLTLFTRLRQLFKGNELGVPKACPAAGPAEQAKIRAVAETIRSRGTTANSCLLASLPVPTEAGEAGEAHAGEVDGEYDKVHCTPAVLLA